MGNYGELRGFMRFRGICAQVVANALVFLIHFLFILSKILDSDFHAFNDVLYVHLSHLYKPPKEYTSEGHLARVMKKQDTKCLSGNEQYCNWPCWCWGPSWWRMGVMHNCTTSGTTWSP